MEIGDPVRTIIVEPAENPVPERERQSEPVRRPEFVPTETPEPIKRPEPVRQP